MDLSFYALVQFFGDEHSLIERGEKALKASHLQSFSYSGEIGVAKAMVKASMKQKTYSVEVSMTVMFVAGNVSDPAANIDATIWHL